MTRESKDLLVGLDIGTSKVVTIVAEMHPDGGYGVLGVGQHASSGLKKGVVVDIERTVTSIQAALEEAELMAGCKIKTVITGIAGSHIRSFNSIGMVAIKDREVTEADVVRVTETAKAVSIPTDQQVLHVLPQEYIIDGQEDIRQPVGMSGVRLDVKVHIVTAAVSAVQNIIKCIRRCGLEVQDLILQPIASSAAVLTADEKELGVVLVDIGGGTSLLPGMAELAEDIFLKPVRVGAPDYDGPLADVVRTPRFANAMGLVEEARQIRLRGRKVAEQSGSFRDMLRRLKEWFLGNF